MIRSTSTTDRTIDSSSTILGRSLINTGSINSKSKSSSHQLCQCPEKSWVRRRSSNNSVPVCNQLTSYYLEGTLYTRRYLKPTPTTAPAPVPIPAQGFVLASTLLSAPFLLKKEKGFGNMDMFTKSGDMWNGFGSLVELGGIKHGIQNHQTLTEIEQDYIWINIAWLHFLKKLDISYI
ncbi:hypothetical protein B0O80DRAFT_497012 [Mortierella sp. GBAus27b]|nr:hypothetical protein B0O80DRAFT_497012 [Mortierella sp. GBAus27b]